jgi:hypothetical protein
MRTPSDGWDPDEREVLASAELDRQLDAVRERHTLGQEDEARLRSRIQREARTETARMRGANAWPRWGRVLAAASVVLIAGTIWMLRREGGTLPGARAPEPAVGVAPPPSPVFYLPLDKPAVKISPASLAYRGPAGLNPLLADLKPAFDAFRAGDYPGADREFSALSTKYASSVEIPFYQGVARLLMGNARDAIASLTAAERLADSAFAWDVAWYRAVAEERAGDLAGARRRLTALCGQPDSRAKSACDALKLLPAGRVPTP